jgi:hypothetical protein
VRHAGEGGEVTNPDNVVGLDDVLTKWRAWLPLIGPDVARRVLETCIMDVGKLCRAAPAGMVLVPREIVANYRESTHIPRHRRICDSALAAPAGGDVAVGEIGELNGTKLIVGRDEDALARLPKGTKLYTRPQDSAPAGSGEVEAMLDELILSAMNDRDELLGWEASEDTKQLRAALLRKLQQGAAIPPHDAEEYRNIVFNPDERTSAIIRQAQATGWNKCRAWLIAASQGQEGGNDA